MLTNVLITAAAWGAAIVKLNAARRRWKIDHRFLHAWIGMATFAFGLTVQIDPVYITIDTLTGIPNLAWLLTDVTMFVALYCAVLFAYALRRIPTPHWLRLVLFISMGLHLLIFFSSIVNMPETKWSAHCSYTLPVYLFVEIENVYGAIIGVTIFQSFVRLWQGEANPLTRVRWSLLSVLAFFGTTLYLLCTASCTVDYFARDHVLAKSLGFAALVLRCAVSLMWPLVILPNHVYLALGKPLVILGKARTLRALLLTRAAIGHVADSMCPPTTCAKHQTGFWQSLRDLDFYIYQAVVSILDGVRTIKLSLEQGEGCECLEIVRVAELVCYLMEGITDDVEYGDLIAACIETGRQLKTKPRRRSAPALRAA